VTEIPLSYPIGVAILDLLPGGDHLLVVLTDGAVDVVSLAASTGTITSKPQTKLLHESFDCSSTGLHVTVDDHYWIMSSEKTGHIIIQLSHPLFSPFDPKAHTCVAIPAWPFPN
jgi:hypothetical protein